MNFPKPLQYLMETFQKILPGVGPKTAERFALALARKSSADVKSLTDAIVAAKNGITTCQTCFDFAEKTPCAVCADPKRDATLLCVVADPQDVLAIEKTDAYKGRYLVLGGLLSPIEGRTPDQLKIKELQNRIQDSSFKIQEIILAFDSTMDGEATVLYIKRMLAPSKMHVTRLARGLPMGGDLEYADEITLTDALQGRRNV